MTNDNPAGLPAYSTQPPVPPAHGQPPAPGMIPTYPQAPSASQELRAPAGTSGNTLWIWLTVAAQVAMSLSIFLFPWDTFTQMMADSIAAAENGAVTDPMLSVNMMTASLGMSVVSFAALAAVIVFSYFDYRELGKRGVVRPFTWLWSLLTLVSSIAFIVYLIGRARVLAAQGIRSWAPLWASIAAQVFGIIIAVIFTIRLMNDMMTMIGTMV